MDTKELIISLIKDDLVNDKLVNGLIDIGLNPGDYFLHLSETIFKLMGFGDNMMTDEIFDHYLRLSRKAKHIDISSSNGQLEALANEIYNELSDMKVTGEYSR
jgi:hypothetical protein